MVKFVTSSSIIFIEELKNRLSSDGIVSEIIEDNNTFINASGEITKYSLLVNEKDIDKATEIKKACDKEANSEDLIPWCNKCGDDDVSKEIISHKHSSIIYLILAPFLFLIGLIGGLGPIFNWFFIIGGILFCIQFFRGHKEEIFTCNKCGHRFHRS